LEVRVMKQRTSEKREVLIYDVAIRVAVVDADVLREAARPEALRTNVFDELTGNFRLITEPEYENDRVSDGDPVGYDLWCLLHDPPGTYVLTINTKRVKRPSKQERESWKRHRDELEEDRERESERKKAR
jgi:hypothetical protein